MVSHGHFVVNGKKLNVPSYQVRIGDKIEVRLGSQKSPLFQDIPTKLKNYTVPSWLSFDMEKREAVVKAFPKNTEGFLNFSTVLEFYSR